MNTLMTRSLCKHCNHEVRWSEYRDAWVGDGTIPILCTTNHKGVHEPQAPKDLDEIHNATDFGCPYPHANVTLAKYEVQVIKRHSNETMDYTHRCCGNHLGYMLDVMLSVNSRDFRVKRLR